MTRERSGSCVGDFIKLQRGTTYIGNLVGRPGPALLGLGSIAPNGGFRDDGYKTYGGDCPQKLMLSAGDLYVSLKDVTQSADLLGAVARVPRHIETGRLTQDTVKLEFVDKSIEVPYLYWLLRTPQYRAYCKGHSMGTTNLSLSREDFLSYPVPELTLDRKAIVEILEGVEEKIELNRKQNRTLEAIAQALFKRWFVEFEFPYDFAKDKSDENGRPYKSGGGAMQPSEPGEIPVGWEVVKIGDVVEILGGGTPSTTVEDYWLEGDVDWYSPTDLTRSGALFATGSGKKITRKGLDNSSAKMFPAYSLMMTSRATIGVVAINREPACTNQGFITMIPNDKFSLFQLHGWLLQHLPIIHSKASGSTFKEINRGTFRSFDILETDIGGRYSALVEPLYQKIETNLLEMESLSRIRDTLLPKLISGELRVA